jgi:hypothetical protein
MGVMVTDGDADACCCLSSFVVGQRVVDFERPKLGQPLFPFTFRTTDPKATTPGYLQFASADTVGGWVRAARRFKWRTSC